MNNKAPFFRLFLILVLFHGGLALNYPARNWLQLNESERVGFLCGYVMGVDTGKDVAFDYDGKMYENLFNSNFQYRKTIVDKTSELYKDKKNLYINWQSMILLSYAYSGGFRPGIPTEAGHPFRTIPATVSDLKPATFEVGVGMGGRNRAE